MSQIEPDDYSYQPPFLPPDMDPEEFYDDEMESRGFQPGFRPPGPRPPIGQPPGRPPFGGGHRPRPPGPPMGWFPERWGKYQWPFWGHWGYRLRNAWQDVKYLSELIQDVVVGMISSGIIAPGPNSPVSGPGGGTSGTGGVTVSPNPPVNPTIGMLWFNTTTGALMVWDGTKWAGVGAAAGVTDGSNAPAGSVGEFLHGTSTVNAPAYPNYVTQNVTPLTVPAGDWDIWADLTAPDSQTITVGNVNFYVTTIPTGLSNDIQGSGAYSEQGQSGDYYPAIIGTMARGNFTASTPIPFTVVMDMSTNAGLQAVPLTMTVSARRRR